MRTRPYPGEVRREAAAPAEKKEPAEKFNGLMCACGEWVQTPHADCLAVLGMVVT